MQKLAIKEVHGYRAELGLPVFTPDALEAHRARTGGTSR